MKMGVRDKGGFHQQFVRSLEWNHAAKEVWHNLPDPERQSFKANWATFGNYEFCTQSKKYVNKFEKGTSNVGEMMTLYKTAEELGGWQHEACRKGAFKYGAMCLKVNKQALTADTNWSGLRMFKTLHGNLNAES
jgi:hypothetical protein